MDCNCGLWKLVSLTGIQSLFMLWKWINQHVTRVGQRKIWVPDRIRTYDLPINTGWALYPLELRRTHEEQGPILGSYLTHVLHTAIYVVWNVWYTAFGRQFICSRHKAVILPFTCILSSSIGNNKDASQLALLTLSINQWTRLNELNGVNELWHSPLKPYTFQSIYH